jgi:hypothetical protein
MGLRTTMLLAQPNDNTPCICEAAPSLVHRGTAALGLQRLLDPAVLRECGVHASGSIGTAGSIAMLRACAVIMRRSSSEGDQQRVVDALRDAGVALRRQMRLLEERCAVVSVSGVSVWQLCNCNHVA